MAMATRAFVVEGRGHDVLALGDRRHDEVAQFFGADLLGVVLDVAVIPERVDEHPVLGLGAGRLALVAEVAVAKAQHAVVGRGRAGQRLRFGVGPEGGLAFGHWVAEVHRLRIAVRERPDFRIGRAVEQKSVERHAPVGFPGLQRDEISAGGREGEGDLLGERGLAGAFELDGDLGRLLQRIQLEVINDVCGQGGRRALVRGEAYGKFLHAWFFDDDGDE